MGYIILQHIILPRLWKLRGRCVEREEVGSCEYEYGWKAEIKRVMLRKGYVKKEGVKCYG